MDTATFDAALSILRVTLGLTLAAHGYQKFFAGGRIPGTAGWFDSMGMKPGKVHALMAASTEIGAGILLALGLMTPFAAAAFVALMVVAGYTVHRENGFFIVRDGYEYNMILAVVAVCISMLGPGAYSLDRVLDIDDALDGWVGLTISAGLGLVSSIGLLAVFFRPPAADPGDS